MRHSAGGRTAIWTGLGAVGLMEARRLRDKFSAEVQGATATVNRTRATFGELASEWLAEQKARREGGEMSPRTYEAYELALRRHVIPVLGSRQVRAISPDELVGWIRRLRTAGYAPHSIHNYWAPINLVLRQAVRHGILPSNPAERLTSAERPKPGPSRRRFLDKLARGTAPFRPRALSVRNARLPRAPEAIITAAVASTGASRRPRPQPGSKPRFFAGIPCAACR